MRHLLTAPLAGLFAVALAGCSCSESHVRDDAGAGVDTGGIGDYACLCCDGTTILARGPEECPALCATHRCEDAGPAPDAGSCRPAGDVVCFTQAPVAGDPFTAEITIGPSSSGTDCYCGQALVAESSVSAERVDLGVGLCPPEAFCAACEPAPTARRTFTPAREGRVTFRINGTDAFMLGVAPTGAVAEPTPTCIRSAQLDGCSSIDSVEDFDVDRACFRDIVPDGARVTIRVEEACGACEQIGPCTVTVSDDNRIWVEPTRGQDLCDHVCPGVCTHYEHVCVTPPLPIGHYEIVIPRMIDSGLSPNPTLDVGAAGLGEEVCHGPRRGG